MDNPSSHKISNGHYSNSDPNGEPAAPDDEDLVSQDSMNHPIGTVNGEQAKTTRALTSHGSKCEPEPCGEQATTSQICIGQATSQSEPCGVRATTSQDVTSQTSTSQKEPNGTEIISPNSAQEVDSGLGEYITKQYGLLKQILSFLTSPRDIYNAKLVNAEWSIAAEAVGHNPVLLVCSSSKVKGNLEKPVLPKLILYQSPTTRGYINKTKVCLCNLKYFICPCTASSDDTLFVNLLGLGRQYRRYKDKGKTGYAFWKSIAIILPSSRKINVSKFASGRNIYNQKITDTLLNSCIGGEEPIKCLIVIAKAGSSYKMNRWIDELVHNIIERQGKTFAFGGGDIRKFSTKLGEFKSKKDKWDQSALVLITLRGNAVTAHSAILTQLDNQGVTQFMQEFSTQVGPHPERGATRLAFIAQCVDREMDEVLNKHESEEFEKYFPLLPQFGFHAYGEYGMNSQIRGVIGRVQGDLSVLDSYQSYIARELLHNVI